MRVRYTPRAFADREEIFAYLDARNPHAARDVKRFIKERVAGLASNPRRSPLIEEFGVRTGSDATPTSFTIELWRVRSGFSISGT